MAKKSGRGMALVFVVLIVGLLASNVSAAPEDSLGDLKLLSIRDTIPPNVLHTAPNGADIPVTTTITITFDETMNTGSVELAFSLIEHGWYVEGYAKGISGEYEWSQQNTVMNFIPSSDLNYDTNYRVGFGLPTAPINRIPMDSSGNILSKYDGWQFTTASEKNNSPNMRPTVTHAKINPDEGETSVTFEGSGVDDDGEVVECRWIFPDGQIRTYSGSSSSVTLEDAPEGKYRFAVRDDDGAWSEEVELRIGEDNDLSLLPIIVLLAIAAIVAMGYLYVQRRKIPPEPDTDGDEFGSISVTSSPDGATVLLGGVDKGKSPLQMDVVLVGPHIVLFTKSGYSDCEKKAVVTANETTPVHCDLETKAPEIKLVPSAEPTEIPADGKSKSVITIRMEDKNGVPIPVPEETEITLETNIGLIDTPVSIPAGDTQARSILTSSTAGGTATVRAKSEIGLESSVAVRFT